MKFFTADLHLQHTNVLKMSARPYDNVQDMGEHYLEVFNRTVSRKDTLIFLGDVAWKSPRDFLRKLKCKDVHLIYGNHDKRNYAAFFKTARDVNTFKLQTGSVTYPCFASHYAHAFWPKSHYGSYHVYGHHHGQRERFLDGIWPQRRSMDVGVDWANVVLGEPRPFSQDEILFYLAGRTGHHDVSYEMSIQKNMESGKTLNEASGVADGT